MSAKRGTSLWLRLWSNSSFMRCKRNHRVLFAVCSISQTRSNILFRQLRIIVDDFPPAHSRGNPPEHVTDRNAQPAHGRLSAALARLDGDKLTVIHVYFDASMSPVL